MQYREFGKTGKKLSVLGWGLMRLPQGDEKAAVVVSLVEVIPTP